MTQFEKTVRLITKPWFFVLYIMVIILLIQFADVPIAHYFNDKDWHNAEYLMTLFTQLGQVKIYLILFFILGLFFRYINPNQRYEQRSWFLLCCILVPNLIGLVLKITLSRARPELLFTDGAFGLYWFKLSSDYWSFPSGHTVTVVSLAAGLGMVFPRYFYGFLSLAFLVILSRVWLCYHYLSDVLGSLYLSLLTIGVLSHYLKHHRYLDKAFVAEINPSNQSFKIINGV